MKAAILAFITWTAIVGVVIECRHQRHLADRRIIDEFAARLHVLQTELGVNLLPAVAGLAAAALAAARAVAEFGEVIHAAMNDARGRDAAPWN